MTTNHLRKGSLGVVLLGLLMLAGPACLPLQLETGPTVYTKKHAKKGGPPPWAPAHGYRHKRHGHDLVFDTKIGVYVIVDLPGHYFYHDRFYRRADGRWWVSAELASGWAVVTVYELPPGLRPTKSKRHKHHRRRVPAKPAY